MNQVSSINRRLESILKSNNTLFNDNSQVQNNMVSAEQMQSFSDDIIRNGFKKPKKTKKQIYIEKFDKLFHDRTQIVLKRLRYYHEKYNGVIFVSQVRLARECDIDIWYLKKILKHCYKNKWLFKSHIYRDGFYERKRICCYFFSYVDRATQLKYTISVAKAFSNVAQQVWYDYKNCNAALKQVFYKTIQELIQSRRDWKKKLLMC
jgi:hypothetical protein